MMEPGRYWDGPAGDRRRRVVHSAQLDIPGHEAKAKTMAALGLLGAVPGGAPALPRRFGRWLVPGVAGLALLGGWWSLRAPRPAPVETAIETREPSPMVATPLPPAPAPEPLAPSVLPSDTVAAAAPALRQAPEKRRETDDDLGAQLALIDGARALLAQGSAREALLKVREYDARYPSGAFGLESTALRVEALLRAGERDKGQALGERFVSQHPKSPYAARIRSLLAPTP